jgi:hypothetical protein
VETSKRSVFRTSVDPCHGLTWTNRTEPNAGIGKDIFANERPGRPNDYVFGNNYIAKKLRKRKYTLKKAGETNKQCENVNFEPK